MEDGPKFLTPDNKKAFNCLRLVFTGASILRHFDPKCHIRIEIDISGLAISRMLSQLISKPSPDRISTKTDLGQ